MEAGRQAECPNCGAPIAWQLASSHSLVCSFCRFAVLRSDRGLGANGRVADLMPTAAPIAVGDEGAVGGKAFRVLGRTQLDHGRGPWDEWYLGFADGTWGWLARAEGRWYLTFARELESAPSWDTLTPGSATLLSGTASMRWVVTERGGSALLSAEGELPFKVEPQASGRYVDLEGDEGAFATLDYGDDRSSAQLFAGRELLARELTLKQTALGPRPIEKVEVERLTCPKCGAPIPIFVPSETERCGCEACGALLDYNEGALRLLTQLDPPAVRPLLALGTVGELLGRMRTVIGFMQRMLKVEGDLYTFREYLLHSEQGYSWLIEENHHWLHVSGVATSAVRERPGSALFEGRVYPAFAKGQPVVDFVVGEFYWKVEAGDVCETFDYVAPPRVLSVERTPSEVSWSEGEYVTRTELQRAFGLKQALPAPIGIGAAEPNPHTKRGAALVFALLLSLWFVLAFAYELGTRKEVLLDTNLPLLPHQGGTPARSNTVFSEPFEVRRGPTTLHVELHSPIDNGWVQLEAALTRVDAGGERELAVVVEHYHGYSDGENWSEGGDEADGYFGRVESGKYTLRMVGSWESGAGSPPTARVRVSRGERSPFCCCGALFLIALPWLLSQLRRVHFEQRRRENENL